MTTTGRVRPKLKTIHTSRQQPHRMKISTPATSMGLRKPLSRITSNPLLKTIVISIQARSTAPRKPHSRAATSSQQHRAMMTSVSMIITELRNKIRIKGMISTISNKTPTTIRINNTTKIKTMTTTKTKAMTSSKISNTIRATITTTSRWNNLLQLTRRKCQTGKGFKLHPKRTRTLMILA